jgi:hypothetical protein
VHRHPRAGALTCLLVAQLDLADLVVLDGDVRLADDLAGAAGPQGYEPRVRAGGWAEAAGADVVLRDVRVGAEGVREILEMKPGA